MRQCLAYVSCRMACYHLCLVTICISAALSVTPAIAQTDASKSANPLAAALCRSGGGVPTTFDRVLYVDQDDGSCSNDGSGSSMQPFCSIQSAVKEARPGTAIRIRNAGSPYNESVVVNKSGAPGKPIVIEADEGHKPVLTNTVNTEDVRGAISIFDASYVVVRNLTFNGFDQITSWSALFVHAKTHDMTDVILTGNTIANWAGTGRSRNWKVSAILFSRAYPRRMKNSVIRCNTLDGNRFRGIVINGSDVLVENNLITRMQCGLGEGKGGNLYTNAQAIQVSNTNASDGDKRVTTELNLIIRNNFIDGVVKDCPYAETVGQKKMRNGGIWCDVGAAGGKVYGNTILNMSSGDYGGGSWGIHIESRCDNWHVYDNLVANSDAPTNYANYRLRNSSGTVFENNISCGGDRAFWIKRNFNKAVTIRNNRVYGGKRILTVDDAMVNGIASSHDKIRSAVDRSFLAANNKNMGVADCPIRSIKALESQK